jgi:pyruvate/2-oxoglutarate dehydrogenase complex dihydrolipoamide dehydrogenase (E3) component
VLKKNSKVLGIHIAAPNAGEIIQGFAVAIKKDLYYEVLSHRPLFRLINLLESP